MHSEKKNLIKTAWFYEVSLGSHIDKMATEA
jgi:hypothetical protein